MVDMAAAVALRLGVVDQAEEKKPFNCPTLARRRRRRRRRRRGRGSGVVNMFRFVS